MTPRDDLYHDQVPPYAPGDDRQPRDIEADETTSTIDESKAEGDGDQAGAE